ncbi:MAG: hypothetical protein ACD_44C00357G0009 [uncultured bacterium]|nr:MAG: hypothetical protein ACD_44C00357G0009 [uncultured bacterium]OGT16197.1 MAG: hypothetical protein A3B69_00865 [Gammaproteobacteria bacterium RIFCSPHIGHO2_02_FULL_38_33]OGT24163.1 MAG: hypothetical protein A2W47_01300 [Gammaproteobacteria bacterium RIFCSPHIGHO2_12_38_15]OGT69614.1 MAG: hypothetical protein A3I12_03200 [Gammaproteobacteria bacterium RIFCSPLOWO2_02_FULL_38_11]OGT75462.1 MAG: hypothetical protein A3G71_06450 [Gammaproteobacteria bacterium RIFCSPLOWO2_12_FULL_38_14]
MKFGLAKDVKWGSVAQAVASFGAFSLSAKQAEKKNFVALPGSVFPKSQEQEKPAQQAGLEISNR